MWRTPHTLPLLQVGFPHLRQSFTNFSNVNPSHRLQLMNCSAWLPSRECSPSGTEWFPMGSQVLPAKLLHQGLLPRDPQAGTCSSTGFPWDHSLLWAHAPAPLWGSPRAAGGCLLHHGPPWAVGAQLPQRGLHLGLQGNLCPSSWSTSCLSLCTDPDVCRAVPLTSPHSSHWLQLLLHRTAFPTA